MIWRELRSQLHIKTPSSSYEQWVLEISLFSNKVEGKDLPGHLLVPKARQVKVLGGFEGLLCVNRYHLANMEGPTVAKGYSLERFGADLL
jgi:hypothetical protein